MFAAPAAPLLVDEGQIEPGLDYKPDNTAWTKVLAADLNAELESEEVAS